MTGNLPEREPLEHLKDQPWLRSEQTQKVLALLEQGGFEARVVGGAVRNALLGRPIKDIDIATTATPDTVLSLAKQSNLKAIATGIEHGTVTVVSGNDAYEVTTLRKDVSTDGRRAVVAFTDDWLSDAERRDFTINAIYCDRLGNLFDPVNGLGDIAARQVRFVGSPRERIEEDYLRSLRFFRFFAEYGENQPDPTALSEIISCRDGLKQLSGERVRQELLKILVAPRAVEIVQIMQESGLLPYLLPVVPRLNHFARLCGCHPTSKAVLRLAVLGVATNEDSKRVTTSLRLSNAEAKVLEHVAALYYELNTKPDPKLGRRWLYEDGEELYAVRVHASQSSSFAQIADPGWDTLAELPRNWQPPDFPLTGSVAIEMGIEPGPEIGIALAAAKRAWIESDFKLRKEDLIPILLAHETAK